MMQQPNTCLPLVAAAGLLIATAPAAAQNQVPINETLNPGQVLTVEFTLDSLNSFPDPFNTVDITFWFDGAQTNFTWQVELFDDSDDSLLNTNGPNTSSFGLGAGGMFTDPSMGGSPITNMPTDLTSYLDGTGSASMTLLDGEPITIDRLEVFFGYRQGSTSGLNRLPLSGSYTITDVPEPASLALLSLAGLLVTRRRRPE